MKALSNAVALIAVELHPDRIDAVCSALGLCKDKDGNSLAVIKDALGTTFSPGLIDGFAEAFKKVPKVSPGELSAMFRAASAAACLVANSSSAELVWTGPATGIVPIRHTAQVLTGLIEETRKQLFLVSFVAYNIANVIAALQRALDRGVLLRVLLEASTEQGGNVRVDSISMLKEYLPRAQFYQWDKTLPDSNPISSVHAKCAVADGAIAFVTSANLSEAALDRNMELGVLIRGGLIPDQLDRHLQALIITKQLKLA